MSPRTLLPLLFLALLVSAPQAATITVTTSDDEVNSDGDCAFREAIRAANTNEAVDACPAGGGGAVPDTINLPEDFYVLSIAGENEDQNATGDLDIRAPVNIVAQGDPIVDGGGIDRVFHILQSAAVTITGVRISSGFLTNDAGACVFASSGTTLTLVNATVEDCFNDLNDGGGVANNGGTVTLRRTTVSDCYSARNGGGIHHDGGTLILENATVSGNAADDFGGGIYVGAGTVQLSNATITGNEAESDVDGIGRGGGILRNGGTITARNTLIADNDDFNDNPAPDCGVNPLTSAGYNLIGDTTFCTIVGDTTGNLVNLDPVLDLRSDNGGPTETHALDPGSPAIDAGRPTGCTTDVGATLTVDQRSVARPQGTRCDIGAFEYEPPLPTTTTTSSTSTSSTSSTSLTSTTSTTSTTEFGATTSTTTSTSSSTSSTSTTTTSTSSSTSTSTTVTSTTSTSSSTSSSTTSTTASTLLSTTTSTSSTTTTTLALCEGGVAITLGSLTFSRLGGAADDRLVFRGTLPLPANMPDPFDPLAAGAQLRIEDEGSASTLVDLVAATLPIPPGAPGTGCTARDGWRLRASPRRWVYTNRSAALGAPACTPGSAQGLVTVVATDRRARGKGIAVRISIRDRDFPTLTGPVHTTVVLGADATASASGACGIHAPAPSRCTATPTKLTCR